jgi:hypothetical protein
VARSCSAAGLTAKVVNLPDLPDKGDVSDWLRTRTIEDLVRVVTSAAVPKDTPNQMELADILTSIQTFIRRFVVLTPEQATALVLFTAHTSPARGWRRR